MRSIISRIGSATGSARDAVGRAGSAVGERMQRGWTRARAWARGAVGGGAVGAAGYGAGRAGGGSGSGNDPDEEFMSNDVGQNYSRSNQLIALNTPIEAGGGFSEPQGKGTFDPAVVQILRSIDANIRSMRDSISNLSAISNSNRNSVPRASSRMRQPFPGDYALTGLGLLGVGAGQVAEAVAGSPASPTTPSGENVATPQPTVSVPTPPAPEIASTIQTPTETLQQNIGVQGTPTDRSSQQQEISQLRSAIDSTRSNFQESIANNRNQRQNRNIVTALLRNAENNVTQLDRLYNNPNPDAEMIADLRRQILENIQSARNYITPTVTPETNNRTLPEQSTTPDSSSVTPDATTPTAPEDNTPGPQSSLDTNGLESVVNNRMGDYFMQAFNTDEIKNNYMSYIANAMSNNNSISVQNRDLTSLDIVSGNEDNVERRLDAIQASGGNDATPVIINAGGGGQPPQIIQQSAPQTNSPAPTMGAGEIRIGYRSHPMLVNEPRSPALSIHP